MFERARLWLEGVSILEEEKEVGGEYLVLGYTWRRKRSVVDGERVE